MGPQVCFRVEEEEEQEEGLCLGWRVTGIGVVEGGEEGTIISAVTFFKPCGVGSLSQTLCAVSSHTWKRGCDLG